MKSHTEVRTFPPGIARKLAHGLLLLLLSKEASGVSLLNFDARATSMGGVGVVTGRAGNSAFLNPAVLQTSRKSEQGTFFLHAYAGARAIDRDNLRTRIDELEAKDYEASVDVLLDESKTEFDQGRLLPQKLRELGLIAKEVGEDLDSLSHKPVRASASIGLSFGRVGRDFSLGFYTREYFIMGGVVEVSSVDLERMRELASISTAMAGVIELTDRIPALAQLADATDLVSIERLAAESVINGQVSDELRTYEDRPGVAAIIEAIENTETDLTEVLAYTDIDRLEAALLAQNDGNELSTVGLGEVKLRDYLSYQIPETLDSTIRFNGAEIEEVALVFATDFMSEQLSTGVTIKYLRISVIDYIEPVLDIEFKNYKLAANQKRHGLVNLDVGARFNFRNGFGVGGVIKNIIPRTIHSVLGREQKIEPSVRLGFSYTNRNLNAALDIDVTSVEPLGFDPDRRYLGIGVEWLAYKQFALRSGYRINTVDGEGFPSIGFGFGFQAGHVDLAVARSTNGDEWGLSLQAGFQF